MSNPHRLHGLAPFTLCLALLALAPGLRASPPEPIAALLGEWTGAVSRGVSGEALAKAETSARRYWDEGDVVRAEVILGGEGTLRTMQIAIVPRGSRYIRIVTTETGATDYSVGSAAEGGVLWTPLRPGRERFIERVSGKAKARKLELLAPEADGWRTVDAMTPATASAFGGSLDGSAPAAASVEPLVLPAESELALLERLAEQIELTATAKANGDRLARELAAAWRETEEAKARSKAAETEAAKARAELKSAGEIGTVGELQQQIEGARRNLKEARDWGAELEKNLEETTRRAEAGAARVKTLETELAAQKDAAAAALAQATTTEGQRQELLARLSDAEKKRQATEAALAEAGRARTSADEARAKAESELAAARSAVERATTEKTDLERRIAQLTAATSDAARLNTELATERSKAGQLESELAKAKAALATAETGLAAAAQRETERGEEGARLAKALEDLRAQQTEMTKARDEAVARLTALAQEVEQGRTGSAQLVAELGALKARADERAAEAETLRKQLADVSGSGAQAAEERAQLQSELATARQELQAATAKATSLAQAESERQSAEAARAAAAAALTALQKDAEAMRTTTVQLQKELSDLRILAAERARDAEQAREQLAAASAAGTSGETERAALQSELEKARAETEAARTAVARLDQEVETMRGESASRSREIEALQARLSNQTGTEGAAEQRIAALETELTRTRTELADAQKARAEAEAAPQAAAPASTAEELAAGAAALAQARTRISELETEATGSATRVAELEKQIAVLRTEAESRAAAGSSDARIQDLEKRLADTYARSEARQAEVDRLLQRVAQLEGSTPAGARPSSASPAEMERLSRQLAESEQARRELEQRNAALSAQVRAAPQTGAVAASTPAPATTTPRPAAPSSGATPPATPPPTVAVSSPTPAPAPSTSRPAAPTRPADSASRVTPAGTRPPGSDPAVLQIVQRVSISGYRGSGVESVAVIDGQPYRTGQLIDVVRGVRFQRVEGSEIVFSGPDGAEYRRTVR